MEDQERQRVVRNWCRHTAKDGRVCSLYKDHYGDHAEKHLKSYWKDGE